MIKTRNVINILNKLQQNVSFMKKGKLSQVDQLKDQKLNEQLIVEQNEYLQDNEILKSRSKKQNNFEVIQQANEVISQRTKPTDLVMNELFDHFVQVSKINEQFDLPFKFYGLAECPEPGAGFMGKRIFGEQKLPYTLIIDHLYKIFKGVLYSMQELDEEFLNEYIEKTMATKLINNLKDYKEKGYRFEVFEDKFSTKGTQVKEMQGIIDMVVVRGLSVIRSDNLNNDQYHKHIDIDDMGIVIYTPLTIQDQNNFLTKEQGEETLNYYKRALIRLQVHFQTNFQMKIFKGDEEVILEDNLYTYNHIAIFESQLKTPEKFKSINKLEGYMEWLGKYKFGL